MKTNAEYHNILARKLQWARNAAEFCRVKAATIRDKAVSKIYADIAAEADAEADKISKLSSYYLDRYWNERYGADTEPKDMIIYGKPVRRDSVDIFTDIVNAHHDAANA